MKNVSHRDKGIVLAALIHKNIYWEDVKKILPWVNTSVLKNDFEEKINLPQKEKLKYIYLNLASFEFEEKIKILEQIHPDHFIPILETESPYISGLLLKSLTISKSKEILNFSKPSLKIKIVSATRGKHKTQFFESASKILLLKKFKIMEKPILKNLKRHEIIFLFNWKEVESLLEELGTKEITIACKNLSQESMEILLNKFSKEERKKISLKLERLETPSEENILKARRDIIEISAKYYQKEKIVKIIGLYQLAHILFNYSDNWLNLFLLKLEKNLEETFLLMVKDLKKNEKKVNINKIKDIGKTIKYLSEMEKISGEWKFYL